MSRGICQRQLHLVCRAAFHLSPLVRTARLGLRPPMRPLGHRFDVSTAMPGRQPPVPEHNGRKLRITIVYWATATRRDPYTRCEKVLLQRRRSPHRRSNRRGNGFVRKPFAAIRYVSCVPGFIACKSAIAGSAPTGASSLNPLFCNHLRSFPLRRPWCLLGQCYLKCWHGSCSGSKSGGTP